MGVLQGGTTGGREAIDCARASYRNARRRHPCARLRHRRRRTTGGIAMTRVAVLAAVALGVAMTAAARAHDIGTTQVTATFRDDGSYELAIAVDPDALLTRLQVAAGE